MKRRITTGGKASKVRRGKTANPKRHNVPAVARHNRSSDFDLKEQLDQRTGELAEARKHLAEALEQQTATAEVLSVISSSPGELAPVFSTMLDNAARVCEAKFGMLVLAEGGGKFRVAAMHGAPQALMDKRTREPVFTPGPSNNVAIVANEKSAARPRPQTGPELYRA